VTRSPYRLHIGPSWAASRVEGYGRGGDVMLRAHRVASWLWHRGDRDLFVGISRGGVLLWCSILCRGAGRVGHPEGCAHE